MLKALHIERFTVFRKAELSFGQGLNIFIGENGTGKSHLLKLAYAAIAVSAARGNGSGTEAPDKAILQLALANKLQGVFKPDGLTRLVSRKLGRGYCRLQYEFDAAGLNLAFTFSTVGKTGVKLETTPTLRVAKLPVFLPTRELLSIFPGFVSLYETTQLEFEETWRDTCILLGASLAIGPRAARIRQLLVPLEEAMGGRIDWENGRFFLNLKSGESMEIHLVAEGLRKLATIARLIATGSLLDKGYLFWDEPEANLNPKIVKTVARTILHIAASGIQVFIATHSLFLLRELHILRQRDFKSLDARCFGLHLGPEGSVEVQQGNTMDEIGGITSLDEDLQQSERYLETEAANTPGDQKPSGK